MKNDKHKKGHMTREFSGTKTYIADMESCGVYFTDEQVMALEEKRKELTCHYSGLASVLAYESSN